MIQVLHLSSRWNKFLVSLWISIQSFVFVEAEFHLKFWDIFHKPTTSLFFSLLISQQLRSILPFKDALSNSFEVEHVVFFSVLFIALFHFFRRHYVYALFTHHLVLWRSCSFLCLSIQPECRVFIRALSSYQVLPPFSTGVLCEIFLTPCAIISIVPEAVCCWFHQASSHLVKILFYSFHFQSECCPNYIILIPSLSCFNRSVVVIHPYRSLYISF